MFAQTSFKQCKVLYQRLTWETQECFRAAFVYFPNWLRCATLQLPEAISPHFFVCFSYCNWGNLNHRYSILDGIECLCLNVLFCYFMTGIVPSQPATREVRVTYIRTPRDCSLIEWNAIGDCLPSGHILLVPEEELPLINSSCDHINRVWHHCEMNVTSHRSASQLIHIGDYWLRFI